MLFRAWAIIAWEELIEIKAPEAISKMIAQIGVTFIAEILMQLLGARFINGSYSPQIQIEFKY